MAYNFYTKGTIKVKNADGIPEPFMPNTSVDNVIDNDNDTTLSEIISGLNGRISDAANKGGVKVMYEEPTAENTVTFGNKTLIGYVLPETWSYIVDTTKLDATNAKTSIPFDLYNVNDASIKVDWGDDTTSTFTSADYSSDTALNNTSSTGLIHTYSEPGVYTVKVISNFDKVKLYNSSSASTNAPIYYYRNTITEVINAFPTLNITNFERCFYGCLSLTSIPTDLFRYNTAVTSFYWCFYNCSSLTSIPQDLFKYNTSVTNFSYCFRGCSSLTSIPTGLFDNNTAVTEFAGCFHSCSLLTLTSIPQDLFRYNTAITRFSYCFYKCSSLTSIPQDLFKYNTAVTSFQGCFEDCSSLTTIPTDLFKYNTNANSFLECFESCSSLTEIPQDLFRYNTAITSINTCFYKCSSLNGFTIHISSTLVSNAVNFVTKKTGVTRTVYVPTGSTTQTKFNAVASSLGLTIIGE